MSAQTEEEMCYSATVFTRRKAQPDRGRLKDKETVYWSEDPRYRKLIQM